MGNNTVNSQLDNKQTQEGIGNFLQKYKIYQSNKTVNIKNIANGYKLNIFQKINQEINSNHKHNELIALNCHKITTPKIVNESIEFKSYTDYYQKRKLLTCGDSQLDENIKSTIIRLEYFQIVNGIGNKIYPMKNNKVAAKQQRQNYAPPICSFQQIFTKKQSNTVPLINNFKIQTYQFRFLQQFSLNTLEKEIKFRAENDQYFEQKQIWALIFFCCQAGKVLTQTGLKEPMFSPSAIFINQDSQIKVGEWQFINYEQNKNEDLSLSNTCEEGQVLINLDLQSTLNRNKTQNKSDILLKFYWPPEGIIQMQNTLRLGQLQNSNQKLSEAKNSQVFCLGMTILHMITLTSYYQKQTFSQKQLKRIIENAIQLRYNMDEQMSTEMIQLLFKMLQWDPKQRPKYEDIIQFINDSFENDDISQASQPLIVSSRQVTKPSNEPQVQYFSFKQKQKQTSSITTQLSQSIENKNFMKKIQAQYKRRILQINSNQSQVNSNLNRLQKDDMQGSGIICQGLGDDYDPQIEQQPSVKSSIYKSKVIAHQFQLNRVLNCLAHDPEDNQNQITSQILQDQQQQRPDQDIDFDEMALIQKKYVNFNNQHSQHQIFFEDQNQLCQSFQKLFTNKQYMSRQTEDQQKYISINQFDPLQSKSRQSNSVNFYDFDKSLYEKNSIENLYKGIQAKFQLRKNYEMKDQKDNEETDLRKNIKISELSFQNDSKEDSILCQNQKLPNFNQKIVIKETCSPILVKQNDKSVQRQGSNNQKQNYTSVKSNQSLFTDPNLMAMIRSFTQKNNQPQTPNFQSIRLQNKRSSQTQQNNQIKFNLQSKKLFEEPFDKCYVYENESNEKNQVRNIENQYASNPFEQEPIVKEQFSKGLYQGAKKNGARNGFGTFFYQEGGKYEGYWYNNKMDGHGALYYPDGRIAYEGQWKNDALHGKGVLYNQKPRKIYGLYDYKNFNKCEEQQSWIHYDGWFLTDEKSGFGELLLSNGQKYVGQFKNDMVYGKGKFYRNDGTVIQAQWRENQIIE